MNINMPIISLADKLDKNHNIAAIAKTGTVYPPGLLKHSFVFFLVNLILIVAAATPKYIISMEALASIASC